MISVVDAQDDRVLGGTIDQGPRGLAGGAIDHKSFLALGGVIALDPLEAVIGRPEVKNGSSP
ncbi:hypothetical protein [Tritonibacter scottomollicae]|uniref:hypothetical protein n=1 Tax=Tritonibacter scottomollicae TaxID=483013 RepID=UPI0010573EF4|nr:hypothetical protein [Tritonibacter scottomollicae]